MPVIQPDHVHRIDVDIIQGILETAEAAIGYSLDDPQTHRPATSKFITTSHPVRPVFYPYVVIEILSMSGARLDIRQALFEHTASIRFMVRGKTVTHVHNIINGINEVLERDLMTFAAAGLHEMKVTGSSAIIWEQGTETYARTLSAQCLLFSKYSA